MFYVSRILMSITFSMVISMEELGARDKKKRLPLSCTILNGLASYLLILFTSYTGLTMTKNSGQSNAGGGKPPPTTEIQAA